MKKSIFLTIVFAIFLWSLPCWALPVASVPSAGYEFTSVPDGEKIIHEFIIKNTGDSVLKIENVVPG